MKRLKIHLLGIALASLVLFLIPQITHGQGFLSTIFGTIFSLGTIAALPIAMFAMVMSYILSYIGAQILAFASLFTDFALTLNFKVLDQSNVLVYQGWTIVRDVANLGFVIVIVIIAIATILRFEQYGVKKLLPKLIAAAVIVNFSLAIAGVFIDFSHVITSFFFNRLGSPLSGQSFQLGTAMNAAFGPQKLISTFGEIESLRGALTQFGPQILMQIASLIFIVVFYLIAIFVVLAYALMLFMRYLYLTFLLIIAPIVWLFWVFPALAGQFSKWWNKFFEWVFFAPAVSFFIYLALLSIERLGGGGVPASFTPTDVGMFTGQLLIIATQGAQMIIIAGIMIGGLIIAQNMGITGAKGAVGFLNKTGNMAKAWAGRAAARGATRPLRGEWGRKVTEGMQKFGQNIKFKNKWVDRFAGGTLRLATRPVREVGTGMAKARLAVEKQVEDAKKRLPKGLDEQARQFSTMDNPSRVAVLDNLGKERKKRSDAAEATRKAKTKAENEVSNLEREMEAAGPDIAKRNEIRPRLEEAKQKLEVTSKESEKAEESLKEISKAIDELPNDAREALEKAKFEVKGTEPGQLYGQGAYVMPKETRTSKIESLLKEVAEEEKEVAKEEKRTRLAGEAKETKEGGEEKK